MEELTEQEMKDNIINVLQDYMRTSEFYVLVEGKMQGTKKKFKLGDVFHTIARIQNDVKLIS